MNWFKSIRGIFDPLARLIDDIHTSDEEKLTIKQQMFELQVKAFTKAEEYETALLDAKKTIITAEAQSQSWLARNWRPITMITFLILVCLDSFGWLPNRLAEEAWMLLQIGLGGYVVGRSAEKVTSVISSRPKVIGD